MQGLVIVVRQMQYQTHLQKNMGTMVNASSLILFSTGLPPFL